MSFVVGCLLFVGALFVVCCFGVRCLLFVVRCVVCAAWFSLCCVLFVACACVRSRVSLVVCVCSLFVVRYLWFVAC